MIGATSSKRSMNHGKGCLKHHEEGADNNTENQDEVSASGKKAQFEESMNQHQNMKGQVTNDNNPSTISPDMHVFMDHDDNRSSLDSEL